MTKTLITIAATAFMLSAQAGTMGASASWPYGSTEALSQSSATKMQGSPAPMAATKMDGPATTMASDTRTMGAPAATAVPSQWPYGSTEALSQTRDTRGS